MTDNVAIAPPFDFRPLQAWLSHETTVPACWRSGWRPLMAHALGTAVGMARLTTVSMAVMAPMMAIVLFLPTFLGTVEHVWRPMEGRESGAVVLALMVGLSFLGAVELFSLVNSLAYPAVRRAMAWCAHRLPAEDADRRSLEKGLSTLQNAHPHLRTLVRHLVERIKDENLSREKALQLNDILQQLVEQTPARLPVNVGEPLMGEGEGGEQHAQPAQKSTRSILRW